MNIYKLISILMFLIFSSFWLTACSEKSEPVEEVQESNDHIETSEESDSKNKEASDDEGILPGTENSKDDTSESEREQQENSTETDQHGTLDEKSGLVIVDNEESVEVFVNKQRKLPDGYSPPDVVVPNVPFSFTEDLPKKQMRQEAATALEQLFVAAESAQLDLVAASGYRSYERQKQIYESNVARNGQEHADKFSAKPGTSEHQTGLAMDVTTAEVAFALEQTFKTTSEGTWLAENAHKYGFIIRYPEGKSNITGYSYEPWHIRYVGKDIATTIYENQLTLEEYFGYGY